MVKNTEAQSLGLLKFAALVTKVSDTNVCVTICPIYCLADLQPPRPLLSTLPRGILASAVSQGENVNRIHLSQFAQLDSPRLSMTVASRFALSYMQTCVAYLVSRLSKKSAQRNCASSSQTAARHAVSCTTMITCATRPAKR